MNITIADDKKVQIDMKDQIIEAIEAFDEPITGKESTPALQHLFTINDDAEVLSEHRSEIFHSVTAKLLYLAKHARPDIETLISFLPLGFQIVLSMIGKN